LGVIAVAIEHGWSVTLKRHRCPACRREAVQA
jgi:hypothetical protein